MLAYLYVTKPFGVKGLRRFQRNIFQINYSGEHEFYALRKITKQVLTSTNSDFEDYEDSEKSWKCSK